MMNIIEPSKWLTPLSWLYGLGVGIRNLLFETGVLRSESFDIPVICVGNLTAGGTGKTPHSEYLVRLLKDKWQVAVLSRGYKRKSKGFVLAKIDTPMSQIGDEPYQMAHKFNNVYVAVDADRCEGIRRLMAEDIKPKTDVIILDDAYQHRYVKPGLSILLTDYHRLFSEDKLLPAGQLREHSINKRYADIVVITKCPGGISPTEQRGIERSLALEPWQKVFFSSFKYGKMYRVFRQTRLNCDDNIELEDLQYYNVLLLTGIAAPQQMEFDLERYAQFTHLRFSDHHDFTREDVAKIERAYSDVRPTTTAKKEDYASIFAAFENPSAKRKQPPSGPRRTIIVTTEKDAVRLRQCKFSQKVKDNMYVLPVEVQFLNEYEEGFNKAILDYVRENTRNSRFS